MISPINIIKKYNNNNQEIIQRINPIVIQYTSIICNLGG